MSADRDVGTTIKTATTGAVVGLWWSATKKVEECEHPAERQLYARIIDPQKGETFYQEHCGSCGKVTKETGIHS